MKEDNSAMSLKRIKTSIAFATDPDNPDRLFQSDSPTQCCLCFNPFCIATFLLIFVAFSIIFGIFIVAGKGTMLILKPSDEWWCPSFTNHTRNHIGCVKNTGSYSFCMLMWLVGPCALTSLTFPVIILATLYIYMWRPFTDYIRNMACIKTYRGGSL